ncbi:MAG: type I restriction-modification enzyme R subunit C-terminal domain-containing protein, partial [Henriciella sp.]|uniref:type I restriction-modification enzyme R subunit C-terminal domain-containing protein n=1 Tax=Henriciella sp. TaxID=1968823 RepID=UPI003C769582
QHLREFQDNEKSLPTILTTSYKLSTGVDARNIRNIVLLRPIKSMIEFKQIIGQGTRTFDGKDFFTVYDFVKAYEHFNDPEWDGEPLPQDTPSPGPSPAPGPSEPGPDDQQRGEKIVVKLGDGKERKIRYIAATTYWSHDGRPITAQEFMEQLFGDLDMFVASEEELRAVWSSPERREDFIQRLTELGYDADRMEDMRRLIDAPDSDVFDVLAYVRFTLAPLARAERADAARSAGLGGYEFEMRQFLDYVLQAYAAHGFEELSLGKIRDFLRIRHGGTNDAKAVLGSVAEIRKAFVDIQGHLFC